MTLGCRSCHYSVGITTEGGVTLWCWLHKAYAEKKCGQFRYQPGSDEQVHNEQNETRRVGE